MKTCEARSPVAEPKQIKEWRREIIEQLIHDGLSTWPAMTTAELRQFAEREERRVPYRWVTWCGAVGCQGHLKQTQWCYPFADEIQRRLRQQERDGRVQRLVMPGWQRQLWAFAPARKCD